MKSLKKQLAISNQDQNSTSINIKFVDRSSVKKHIKTKKTKKKPTYKSSEVTEVIGKYGIKYPVFNTTVDEQDIKVGMQVFSSYDKTPVTVASIYKNSHNITEVEISGSKFTNLMMNQIKLIE